MTPFEHLKATAAIHAIAERGHCSPEEIRFAIQEALDAAWAAAWTPGNLTAQVVWQRLFPGAQKPTVEEFIIAISRQIEKDSSWDLLVVP